MKKKQFMVEDETKANDYVIHFLSQVFNYESKYTLYTTNKNFNGHFFLSDAKKTPIATINRLSMHFRKHFRKFWIR